MFQCICVRFCFLKKCIFGLSSLGFGWFLVALMSFLGFPLVFVPKISWAELAEASSQANTGLVAESCRLWVDVWKLLSFLFWGGKIDLFWWEKMGF